MEDEFAGLELPVTQLMPRTAPFCNIDLSPKWGYDLVKAQLLNCTPTNSLSSGAIAAIVVSGVLVGSLVALVVRLIQKERAGSPLFAASKTRGEAA